MNGNTWNANQRMNDFCCCCVRFLNVHSISCWTWLGYLSLSFFCGRFFYLLVIFIGFSSRVFHTFLLFIGLVRSKTYLVAYNTIVQCVLFIFDPPIRKYTVSDKLRHFFLCCSVVSFSPVCFRSNIFCINPLVHHLWTYVNRYHVNIFTRQWPSKGKTI